jgi:prepilin-type N-terminal cleavage/methylation domain-containing protein
VKPPDTGGGSEDSVVRVQRNGGRDSRGFSLIEMLVASAIFAIAAAAAFIIYTATQKSYKAGENFTDQQQSTRVAFDRMISDIRLAGFNWNPDGDATRVDEQLEGVWDTAVTLRSDFDFEDPAASIAPEAALAGINYNAVSTGNDEIVTYALAKPGPSGPDSLTVVLDAAKPRAKANSTIIIPNVAVVQNNPPYTLYRITLRDVAGAFPASPQATSDFVYEPVADNIRTMTFQYWDDAGTLLNANTPANAADDIGGLDATKVDRSRVRRVTVNLVGMTQDEDLDYTDVTDATATQHYRKFDLNSDVNPENLGKRGVKDIDITPPPSPTGVTLVNGHCGGILVKWDTPAVTSGITAYAVKVYPQGSPSSFTTQGFTYPHTEFGVIDMLGHGFVSGLGQGSTYCFQAQAKDAVGNQSGWAPTASPPCLVVTEASTPGVPQNLVATGYGALAELENQIHLTWNEVKSNGSPNSVVSGDPNLISGATVLRDGNGYKLYRDVTSGFTPAPGNLLPITIGNGILEAYDNSVANCQTYYYKLTAIDKCGTEGTASGQATGRAATTVRPSVPTNVQAVRSTKNLVTVTWDPVITNVNSQPLSIQTYRIYRITAPSGTPLASLTFAEPPRGIITNGTTTWADNLDPQDKVDLNNNRSLFYAIKAADLCPNLSDYSAAAEVNCARAGTLTTNPADGTTNGGNIPLSVNLSGATDCFQRVRVTIYRKPNLTTAVRFFEPTPLLSGCLSFPVSLGTWDSTVDGGGDYALDWELETDKGCTRVTQTNFTVSVNLSCNLTMNTAVRTSSGSLSGRKWGWNIVNGSGKALKVFQIDVAWVTAGSQLTTVEWPTGTTKIPSSALPSATPATVTFADTAFTLLDLPNGATVNTSLVWSASIATDALALRYHFKEAPGATQTGSCGWTVSAAGVITVVP